MAHVVFEPTRMETEKNFSAKVPSVLTPLTRPGKITSTGVNTVRKKWEKVRQNQAQVERENFGQDADVSA